MLEIIVTTAVTTKCRPTLTSWSCLETYTNISARESNVGLEL